MLVALSPMALIAQKNGVENVHVPRVRIQVAARSYGDSAVLRWAPGNAALWQIGIKNGYVVKRVSLKKNQQDGYTVVDSAVQIVKPLTVDEFGTKFKTTNDTNYAAVAQLLYGKLTKVDSMAKAQPTINNYYQQYNSQVMRYSYSLTLADIYPAMATAVGLRYTERHIEKGLYYLYTVYPNAANITGVTIDTGKALVGALEDYKKAAFPNIEATAGDRVIKLQWGQNYTAKNYTAFFIEKSEDGKNFSTINKLPFMPGNRLKDKRGAIEYSDSVAADYRNYYYRIYGIDAFGDRSFPSAVIKAMAVDLTPPQAPQITSVSSFPGSYKVQLHWGKAVKEPDLKGYIVQRSTNAKGPFTPLNKQMLAPDDNAFVDETPSVFQPNFYEIKAFDTAGNVSVSLPFFKEVKDTTPLAAPIGLGGFIDSLGHVFIHWEKNTEPNIKGYHVFYANAANQKFTPISGKLITDTIFFDSTILNTLTKHAYYKVVAVDKAFNTSDYSAALELKRPDIVAPGKVLINSFKITDSSVMISWIKSPADDVAKQLVYRKNTNDTAWVLSATLPPKETSFLDSNVVQGNTYLYTVEALDSSNNNSGRCFPFKAYVYTVSVAGSINNFAVNASADSGYAHITWAMPKYGVDHYLLYKGSGANSMLMAATIAGDAISFDDKCGKGSFQYAIRAYYKNGKKSLISAVKTITIQ